MAYPNTSKNVSGLTGQTLRGDGTHYNKRILFTELEGPDKSIGTFSQVQSNVYYNLQIVIAT